MKKNQILCYITLFVPIMVISTFLSTSTGVAVENLCQPVFKTSTLPVLNKPSSELWRPIEDKDLFMAFRSNAPHYWGWMAENILKDNGINRPLLRSDDQKLMNGLMSHVISHVIISGVVSGDPHHFNFSIVKLKETFEFRLVDFDDGGVSPFILDFGRLLVANLTAPLSVNPQLLWQSYFKGLRGKPMASVKMPKIIQQELDKMQSDQDEIQKRWLQKIAPLGKFDRIKLEFIDSFDREEAELVEQKLIAVNDKIDQILDRGVKIKSTGGSQGLVRYWFLAQMKSGKIKVIEWKQLGNPATAQWSDQLNTSDRLNEVRSVFWEGDRSNRYQVFSVNNKYFWMRERINNSLDKKIEKTFKEQDLESMQEYFSYLAQMLGAMHGSQLSSRELTSYLENLDNENNLVEFVNDLVEKYKNEIIRLNES